MPVCLNCSVYSWAHVKVPSPNGPFYAYEESSDPLLRCSKCKMAHYCDKDCQAEHWKKVHKDQCKYSSGKTPLKVGIHCHDSSICPACMEENQVGKMIMSKDDSHWGCHLQSRQDFWGNPTHIFRDREGDLNALPMGVELGELTLNFTSNVEHMVSFLQKILHKMKLTRHELSTRKEFQELNQELFSLRHDFLMKAAIIPPGNLVEFAHSVYFMNSGKLRKICSIINAMRDSYLDNDADIYRLWDTFLLIFHYFNCSKDAAKAFEDLGLKIKDKKMKLLLAQVEPSGRVQEKWEQVVLKLSTNLIPYYDLLDIVLGSLQQECSICKAKITIESTYEDHPLGSRRAERPVALCHGLFLKFHCGKMKCRREIALKYDKDQTATMKMILENVQKYKGNRCDWCTTLKRKVHRCSRCLTKVYCSQECLVMDWKKVHKEVCREKPEVRKMKMNSKIGGKD